MRLLLTIVGGLVAIAVLWRLVHWVLGMAWGAVTVVIIAAVLIFAIGLVRRLVRM